MAFPLKHRNDDATIDIDTATPLRYLSLDHVYSATSPCRVTASGSSNVMSKKVKARKFNHFENDDVSDHKPLPPSPPPPPPPPPPPHEPEVLHVYSRRRQKRPRSSSSFFDGLVARAQPKAVKVEEVDGDEYVRLLEKKKKKRRKFGSSELVKLGVDSNVLRTLDAPRLRECRSSNQKLEKSKSSSKKRNSAVNADKVPPSVKRWVGLSFTGVDPKTFIGLQCKASTLFIGHWMLIHIPVASWDTTLTVLSIMLNMKMVMRKI